MRLLMCMLSLLPLAAPAAEFDCAPAEVLPDNPFPTVTFETSMGSVEVELNRMRAPAAVNNFLRYVVDGRYDNTIFHRVMEGFVVQGGGYGAGWNEVALHPPVMNESGNGLRNNRGTIAMARFEDPHSATSQFYFNMANNETLDPGARNWGYTVFGDVIAGMEVLEAIAGVDTGYDATVDFQDVPLVPVTLVRVSVQ